MNKLQKSLTDALDILDVPVALEEINNNLPLVNENNSVTSVAPQTPSDVDFEIARNNIKEAIDVGKNLLRESEKLAKASDSAAVYKMTFDGLAQFVEANEKLLDLHHKRINPEVQAQPNKVVNNIFFGTTADLIKQIQKVKESQIESEAIDVTNDVKK